MRRTALAAAGLGLLAAAACGTTVPVTSQHTVEGTSAVSVPGSAADSATRGPLGTSTTGGTALSSTTAGTTAAGSASGATAYTGASTGTGGTAAGPAVPQAAGGVDYSRPATGSPVEVGIMYIKDLAAASAQFGASGNSTTDQTAWMKRAVAWMNAHGGLGGHRISLLLYGAEIAGSKTYDQSLQEMCTMMTQDHHVVAAVISAITVDNNMAACMQRVKGLYVTDGGYFKTAADWRSFSYTVSPSELQAELLGSRMAQLMVDRGAAKRGDTVGVVTYDAPGFIAAESQFIALAKASGIEVISYHVHYASSTPDLAASIAAVQSAVLAMKSRGAKVVASLSSGGIMGFFLGDAQQQKYYPRYLLSSNDGPVNAPGAAKPGQLKGALAVGYVPLTDVDLQAHPGLFRDLTFDTCRQINRSDRSLQSSYAYFSLAQRVCQSLLLIQAGAKGFGGTTITGTTLRDGLARLGSTLSAGTPYATRFGPSKHWAPAVYRPMHYDEAKDLFVYDSTQQLPF